MFQTLFNEYVVNNQVIMVDDLEMMKSGSTLYLRIDGTLTPDVDDVIDDYLKKAELSELITDLEVSDILEKIVSQFRIGEDTISLSDSYNNIRERVGQRVAIEKFEGRKVLEAVKEQFIRKYAAELKNECQELMAECERDRIDEEYLYFYYSDMNDCVKQDWYSGDRGIFMIGRYNFEMKRWNWSI